MILVDFGDFNLPVIAPLVKRYGIPILYYISPQVWAWGRWRLRDIRRYVNRMVQTVSSSGEYDKVMQGASCAQCWGFSKC